VIQGNLISLTIFFSENPPSGFSVETSQKTDEKTDSNNRRERETDRRTDGQIVTCRVGLELLLSMSPTVQSSQRVWMCYRFYVKHANVLRNLSALSVETHAYIETPNVFFHWAQECQIQRGSMRIEGRTERRSYAETEANRRYHSDTRTERQSHADTRVNRR